MCKHTKLSVLAHLKKCVQHTNSGVLAHCNRCAMNTQIGMLQESVPSTPNLMCAWRHAEHTVYGVLGTLYFYSAAIRYCAVV